MPRKKRQLKQDLRKAGFVENKNRGKGSHTTWFHPQFPDLDVLIAGYDGDDAKPYDERNVREAISEANRRLAVSYLPSRRAAMDETVDRSPIRPEEWAEARRYALVIEWSDEDGAYLATAPDLPGVVTDGRTRSEAAEMGEEAVAVWLSSLRGRNRPIPAPRFTGLPEHLQPEARIAGSRRSA